MQNCLRSFDNNIVFTEKSKYLKDSRTGIWCICRTSYFIVRTQTNPTQ